MARRGELSLDPTRTVAGSPPATVPARFSVAGLIAMRDDRELVRWRSLDATPLPLWRPPRGRIATFELSPAADRLAVLVDLEEAPGMADIASLWVVDVATGDGFEIVARERLRGPLVFAPDGAALALTVVGPRELAAGGGTHAAIVRLAGGHMRHFDDYVDFDPHAWNHEGLLLHEYEPLGKLRQTLYAWSGTDVPPRHHTAGASWSSPRGSFRIHETGEGIFAEHAGRRVQIAWQRMLWLPARLPWVGDDRLFQSRSIIDLRTGSATEVTSEYLTLETASPDGDVLVFERDGALAWAQLHEAVLASTPVTPADKPAPLPRARVVAMRSHDATSSSAAAAQRPHDATSSPGLVDVAPTLTASETVAIASAWLAAARAHGADDRVLAGALALLDRVRHAADHDSTARRARALVDLERELQRIAGSEPRLGGLADEMLRIVDEHVRARR